MDSAHHIYIAVIHDDYRCSQSVCRYLRSVHLQPITYPSAEAFLTDIKRPKFDCLVLDVNLSGMSGLDLKKRLLAVKDATPVVFITEQDNPKVLAQAKACDCLGCFSKTDSGADILAAIWSAIGMIGSDFVPE